MSSYQKLAASVKKADACKKVAELVLKNGLDGAKAADVAKKLGMCRESCGVYLRMLEKAGAIERTVPKGPQLLWGPIGIRERYISQKKPWPSIRTRAEREKERRAIERLGEDADLLPVKRVIVPAHQARPMMKQGVSSVWELAA